MLLLTNTHTHKLPIHMKTNHQDYECRERCYTYIDSKWLKLSNMVMCIKYWRKNDVFTNQWQDSCFWEHGVNILPIPLSTNKTQDIIYKTNIRKLQGRGQAGWLGTSRPKEWSSGDLLLHIFQTWSWRGCDLKYQWLQTKQPNKSLVSAVKGAGKWVIYRQ